MAKNDENGAGSKHEAQDGAPSPPAAKRSKKTDDTEQLTLEDTLNKGSGGDGASSEKPSPSEKAPAEEKTTDATENGKTETKTESKAGPEDSKPTSTGDDTSAVQPEGRKKDLPSNVLEKGIIYFFFRGRVNTNNPSSINDIARSYFILRPIASDASLTSGPIGDAGNTRLCAIPKKTLPTSGRERWLSFVEKSGASFEELKKEFLAGNEYETKTAGTRHSPAATPVGEGVYAITSTGRTSHLAYLLTLPEELGEVQKKMGIRARASFVISTKNPDYPGPAYARLPESPEYPKELKETFRSLRWPPTEPSHLDYTNAQFLLVGESSDLDKASEVAEGEGQEPSEEMEKLEEEDEKRMKSLGKDESEAIFADLQVHAEDYPKLQTTF